MGGPEWETGRDGVGGGFSLLHILLGFHFSTI